METQNSHKFCSKIIVFGLNKELVFKKLKEKNVVFYDVKNLDNAIEFLVDNKNVKVVTSFLKKRKIKFKILKKFDIFYVFQQIIARSGAIIAILFWLIFSLYLNNNLFEIKVISSDLTLEQENVAISFLTDKIKENKMQQIGNLKEKL